MPSPHSRPALGEDLPPLISGAGVSLFLAHFAAYFWFNGVGVESVVSINFVMGVVTTGPFVGAILYGRYWLTRSRLSSDRYPRIGAWFVGGLVGFLLLNVAMIVVWPANTVYNNVAWALFAAAAGGASGLGIGLFEARAIERAVAVERNRIERAELERRNEHLKEFASVVSHDLRNPLNVASGRLELVEAEHDEHVDAVAAAHDRMEAIVDRTLTLARTGQRIGDTRPVELGTIAANCWENVATADGTLEVAGTATIEADPDRLQHLFENLFRNVTEHTDRAVTVRVGTTRNGFYVEDDGPGIPEADRDAVFDVGYSTSEGGTGFGLSIVEQVVEAHNWRIHVGEGTDGGARFEVTNVDLDAE